MFFLAPKNFHRLLDLCLILAAGLAVLAALLFATPSKAQENPAQGPPKKTARAECYVNEKPGICLPKKDARWVAQNADRLAAYNDLIAAYQKQKRRAERRKWLAVSAGGVAALLTGLVVADSYGVMDL